MVLAFLAHIIISYIAFDKSKLILSFGIVSLVFYLFNLFICNPITVFFKLSCCMAKTSKKRKMPAGLKPSNASKTLSNTHISIENDIELANNTDKPIPQSPQKRPGSNSIISQSQNSLEKTTAAKSINLFAEINFFQLESHYKQVYKDILEAHRRYQLYFRIANINKQAAVG